MVTHHKFPYLKVTVECRPHPASHRNELEPLAPEDKTSVVVLHRTPDGERLSRQQKHLTPNVQLDLLGASKLYEGVVLCLWEKRFG